MLFFNLNLFLFSFFPSLISKLLHFYKMPNNNSPNISTYIEYNFIPTVEWITENLNVSVDFSSNTNSKLNNYLSPNINLLYHYFNTCNYKKCLSLFHCSDLSCPDDCCSFALKLLKGRVFVCLKNSKNLIEFKVTNINYIYNYHTPMKYYLLFLVNTLSNNVNESINDLMLLLNNYEDFYEGVMLLLNILHENNKKDKDLIGKNLIDQIEQLKLIKELKSNLLMDMNVYLHTDYDISIKSNSSKNLTNKYASYLFITHRTEESIELYKQSMNQNYFYFYVVHLINNNDIDALTVLSNSDIFDSDNSCNTNKFTKLLCSGGICLLRNKKEESVKIFKGCLKMFQKDSAKFNSIFNISYLYNTDKFCMVYLLLSNISSSSKYLEQAYNINNIHYFFNIAHGYYKQNIYDKAQYILSRIVSYNSNLTSNLNSNLSNNSNSNLTNNSNIRLNNKLNCCTMANVHKLLGRIYYKYSMYEAAKEEFMRSSEVHREILEGNIKNIENNLNIENTSIIKHSSLDALLYLAELYKKMNDSEKAKEAYEKYVEISRPGKNRERIQRYLSEIE